MKLTKVSNTIIVAALVTVAGLIGQAADHSEAPATRADSAADIADLYAWHKDGKLSAIITFAGLQGPVENQRGTYDKDVRYILNIDNNNDQSADIKVIAQFKEINERWWVDVTNIPGATASVLSEVENITTSGTAKVYAGLRDDPFFFDFDGFQATLATGDLSFDSTRDSFASTNVTAIVLEVDLAAAMGGNTDPLKIWATTERLK